MREYVSPWPKFETHSVETFAVKGMLKDPLQRSLSAALKVMVMSSMEAPSDDGLAGVGSPAAAGDANTLYTAGIDDGQHRAAGPL